jgi:hypothetical protein
LLTRKAQATTRLANPILLGEKHVGVVCGLWCGVCCVQHLCGTPTLPPPQIHSPPVFSRPNLNLFCHTGGRNVLRLSRAVLYTEATFFSTRSAHTKQNLLFCCGVVRGVVGPAVGGCMCVVVVVVVLRKEHTQHQPTHTYT